MVKKVNLFVFALIVMAACFYIWNVQKNHVCIENLVRLNEVSTSTGTYICFSGKEYDVSMSDLALADLDHPLLRLIDGWSDGPAMISNGSVFTGDMKPERALKIIQQMNEMWSQLSEPKLLFSAENIDHGLKRKYVVSASFRGDPIAVQFETKGNGNSEMLLIERSNNTFSKLLGRWHVLSPLAGSPLGAISFKEKMYLMLFGEKSCESSNFCFHYEKFSVLSGETPVIWKNFLEGLESNEAPKNMIMDERSFERLGLKIDEPIPSSLQTWFGNLRPVASLEGNEFVVYFVTERQSELSNQEAYASGAAQPIFFKMVGQKYLAVDLNTVNEFQEFVRRADFAK